MGNDRVIIRVVIRITVKYKSPYKGYCKDPIWALNGML